MKRYRKIPRERDLIRKIIVSMRKDYRIPRTITIVCAEAFMKNMKNVHLKIKVR